MFGLQAMKKAFVGCVYHPFTCRHTWAWKHPYWFCTGGKGQYGSMAFAHLEWDEYAFACSEQIGWLPFSELRPRTVEPGFVTSTATTRLGWNLMSWNSLARCFWVREAPEKCA